MDTTRTGVLVAAVAAGALAAGIFLPPAAYLGIVALLVLAAGAAIALIVQFEQPFVGMAVLVFMGVALPIEFRGPSAGMVSFPFAVAAGICGVWILQLVLARQRDGVDASRVVYATLTLMAITVLAFATGQFPWFRMAGAPLPVQVVELALFLLSGCLFLAVGHQLTSVRQLKLLTWLLVSAGFVTCVLQMAPSLGSIARMTTRPGSVGSLFWTWLVAMCAAQSLFNRKLPMIVRFAFVGVMGLVFYHGLVEVRSWASGWLPPLATLGVIVLFRMPRLTIVGGLASVPVMLSMRDIIASKLMGDEQYSLLSREEAWRVLWQVIERSPIIGTGPVNYYFYTQNFPILGWYVKFFSHNNYEDLLLQVGLVGFLAFFWFAFEAGWLALRLYYRLPEGFARAYAIGALGGLAGSLVAAMLGDWIIPFYYNAGILGFRSSLLFWVYLGGLLTLKRLSAESTAPAPAPAFDFGLARASRSPLGAH